MSVGGASNEAGMTDFDEGDDDDDEDEDFAPEVTNPSSSTRSRVGSYSFASPGRGSEDRSGVSDWQFDDSSVFPGVGKATAMKTKHGKTNQIAKDLSDLVVYTQAVKFRGFQLQVGQKKTFFNHES